MKKTCFGTLSPKKRDNCETCPDLENCKEVFDEVSEEKYMMSMDEEDDDFYE